MNTKLNKARFWFGAWDNLATRAGESGDRILLAKVMWRVVWARERMDKESAGVRDEVSKFTDALENSIIKHKKEL